LALAAGRVRRVLREELRVGPVAESLAGTLAAVESAFVPAILVKGRA
jgi:hypothetical protein